MRIINGTVPGVSRLARLQVELSKKARLQKVAALRRYLRSHTKSDRVDGLTLAKMPFIDAKQLGEAYLPPSEYHSLQRLTRQLERLMKSITVRKNRIGSIING